MAVTRYYGFFQPRQIVLLMYNNPNFITIDKENSKCQIIDFAVPYDTRVDTKETEKLEKYTRILLES